MAGHFDTKPLALRGSSMKTIAIALTLVAAASFQSAPAVESKTGSPLIGAWTVDTSRLPMAPEARPRGVTITFSEAGAERLRMRVEVIDAAGTLLVADGVTPLCGTRVRVHFSLSDTWVANRNPAQVNQSTLHIAEHSPTSASCRRRLRKTAASGLMGPDERTKAAPAPPPTPPSPRTAPAPAHARFAPAAR